MATGGSSYNQVISNLDILDILQIVGPEILKTEVYSRIGLDESDITNATLSHSHNPRECAKTLLQLWRNRNGDAASRGNLFEAMAGDPDCNSSLIQLKKQWGYQCDDSTVPGQEKITSDNNTPWTIREDQIEQKEHLGSGSTGSVYKVIWTKDNGEKVVAAGKYFSPLQNNIDAKEIEDEICMLSEIDHPHIIKYYGAVKGKTATIIVTEYAEGKDLYSHLKKCYQEGNKLPITKALTWAQHVALALEYLHCQKNVTHRDVKSNNIVIMGDGTLKLCDFGLAQKLYSTLQTSRKRGTLIYKSPELLSEGELTDAADIFAFGILLWELLTCRTPYSGCNSDRVRALVLRNERPQVPSDCSISLRILLAACWHADKKSRHDIGTVVAIIEKELKFYRYQNIVEKKDAAESVSVPPEKPQTADKMTNTDITSVVKMGQIWELAGQFSTESELPNPLGITIHPDEVAVAVTNNRGKAVIFSKKGVVRHTITRPGAGEFTTISLSDIAITAEGRYVLPGKGGIILYDPHSILRRQILANTYAITDNGKRWSLDPVSLAVDSIKGLIIAGLTHNHIAIHHGSSGTSINTFDLFALPCGLDVTSNNSLVVTSNNRTLRLMDYSGQNRQLIPCPKGVNRWVPEAVCCSKQDEIFVVNRGDKSVYQFTADGEFLGRIISGLDNPMGIAITKDEQRLYVVENRQSMVKKFQRPPRP